jgi:hypothetical protein
MKYDGPFEIIRKLSPVTYQLRLPVSYGIHPILNIAHLETYYKSPPELGDRPSSPPESPGPPNSPMDTTPSEPGKALVRLFDPNNPSIMLESILGAASPSLFILLKLNSLYYRGSSYTHAVPSRHVSTRLGQ